MTRTTFFSVLLLTTIVLASREPLCAQERQKITAQEMPQSWTYTSGYEQTDPIADKWWKQFSDPTLDTLIEAAISNNYDLLQAMRRIEIARQSLRQIQSAYYPSFSLNGGWNKARTSGLTTSRHGTAINTSVFDLGVDMNWEIDVFGKIYSRAKQGKAALRASRADFDGMMVSIAAKTGSAYFQLRTIQAEIEVAERHAEEQLHVLNITKARFEAALSSKLDVAQAGTTYYSTLASLTSLRAQETAIINSIALLIGEFPETLDAKLRMHAPLPEYIQIVSVGVPAELLRRRPDVMAAECVLAENAAAIGVAKKDFLPTISLTGSISTQAHDARDLFGKESLGYSIAPAISWTLFDGFSRSAALNTAKEQLHIAIDNYNLTILTAVEETENAMAAYSADLKRIDALDLVVEQAAEALKLSMDLYKQGLSDFINVSNSQISLLQYASERVQAQGQALADLVTLYQALGGGY